MKNPMPSRTGLRIFFVMAAFFLDLTLFQNCSFSGGSGSNNSASGFGATRAPVAFVPLHTYYISPTGNDASSGTSPSTAWASPKHNVNCGDVIVASAGTYSSANFGNTGNWGTVSNCPSTSGGIDGNGGVNVANLLCAGPDITSCTVVSNNYTSAAMWVDSSNWAVTGWKATNLNNQWGGCFTASPSNGQTLHHIAFINDFAEGCLGSGVGAGPYYGGGGFGVDEFAAVGIIANNASIGTSECYSGLSIAAPVNYDSSAGTHVFVAGVFSYGNKNGTCGYNAGALGGYTTASATVSSGSVIQVASASAFKVGMPIVDLGSGLLPVRSIIPVGTVISAISGNSIALSQPLAGAVTNGDSVQAALTTDGEGIIFDTWGGNAYTGQAAVEQNVVWDNGNAGIEMFNSSSNTSVYVFNNTSYGNLQDPYHYGFGGLTSSDLIVQNFTSPLSIYNNIFQASEITMGGAPNNTSIWTGDNVYAGVIGGAGASTSITGNVFKSLQSSCPGGSVCDAGDNVAAFNGYSIGANTYVSAGFVNTGALPSAAPNCSGYSTTTACMIAAGVVADLTPTGAASGKGYQPPQGCTNDVYYPSWLKGAVGLSVGGNSALIYNFTNLINKPCNL